MKKDIHIIASIASIGLLVVIIPYMLVFTGGLSSDSTRWADFGTYIGGLVTPLALIATLAALIQNERHRSRELLRLANDSRKSDLIRQIERIEEDIESELGRINLGITIERQKVSFPGRDILFRLSLLEWRKLIPSSEEVEEKIEESGGGLPRLDRRILAFEVFGLCAAHINRLRQYALEHEATAEHNAESLYLKRKYRVAVERLAERGFKVEPWDDVAQQIVGERR